MPTPGKAGKSGDTLVIIVAPKGGGFTLSRKITGNLMALDILHCFEALYTLTIWLLVCRLTLQMTGNTVR